MTSTRLPISAPLSHDMPLAFVVASRLLLTEKSSDTIAAFPLAVIMETIVIRTTMVTAIPQEFEGYSHFGLND